MSWLKKGDEVSSKEFLSSGNTKNTNEFWLKSGKENMRNIIFLDDPGVGFARHTLKIGENFESLTCLDADCPMCAKGYWKTPCIVFSILDLTPWKDKQGNEKKYFKKTLLIKGKAMMELISVRRDANGGTLAGLKMSVLRTDDKAPNSGDDFSVLGKVDLSKLPVDDKKDIQPFNYEELFAPLSIAQVEAKMKYAAPPMSGKNKKSGNSRAALGASNDFGPEPQFNASEEIPF